MSDKPVVSPEQNMTVERLKNLYELIRRMNSVYDLPDLLDFVVDRVKNLVGGERAMLMLHNQDAGKPLNVAVVRGEKLEVADIEQIIEFVSSTVIMDVLEKGETRLVHDLPTDARYENRASLKTLQFKAIRSVLAVPLIAESRQIGLLYIDHPHRSAFGQDELDYLNAFANQAALAIHRAQEHDQQVRELTLLNELSRSLVQVLDLNDVLTRIVTEVTFMLNVEASSVLLLADTGDALEFATSVHNGKPLTISTRLSKDEGIAGWVMTHGKALFANNVHEEPRWFGEVESGFETRSLLCVPLQLEDRTVGVLEALNKKDAAGFASGDITLLSAFAASAAIAIENARLFQEARQARQLRALNKVAMTLSGTLDLDKIMNEGLAHALVILDAAAGAVSLQDDPTYTDLLTVKINSDLLPEGNGLLTKATTQLVTWLLEQPGRVDGDENVFIVDEAHPPGAALAQMLSGVAALAAAPINVRGNIGGVLAVISTAPHTYNPEEISLLNGVARIIELAAQNAIHYLQVQAQAVHLTYLNQIGSVLTSSLDLEHVLRVIIEGVNSLLQTELTSVFLIDPDTDELVLRFTTKGDADIRLPAPWQGIAGWVATHDQPALVNDTHSDPRHLRKIAVDTGYEAHSILCVPLKVEGKVIGVVEVLNRTGGQQFSHYHQSLLMELTRWAAIAIHNARLFDERVQAYQRLAAEQQRRVAAETRGAMAAIILDMAHTMNNVVGAIRAWAINLEYAIEDTPAQPLANFERAIHQIRQNTEEALKLMSNMTGPLEQVEVSTVDVHQCLDAAAQSCWRPEKIQLYKNYNAAVTQVQAHPERLEAVFHNLLSNAIQAMPLEGGPINITTSLTADDQIEIAIQDTGTGIPDELRNRIFNPGVSGKGGSLGIGLWLVETFIHQFGGQIDFVTSPDGTTFTVCLPVIASTSATVLKKENNR
jgi:GAF domain-containing protein